MCIIFKRQHGHEFYLHQACRTCLHVLKYGTLNMHFLSLYIYARVYISTLHISAKKVLNKHIIFIFCHNNNIILYKIQYHQIIYSIFMQKFSAQGNLTTPRKHTYGFIVHFFYSPEVNFGHIFPNLCSTAVKCCHNTPDFNSQFL